MTRVSRKICILCETDVPHACTRTWPPFSAEDLSLLLSEHSDGGLGMGNLDDDPCSHCGRWPKNCAGSATNRHMSDEDMNLEVEWFDDEYLETWTADKLLAWLEAGP